MVFNAGNQKTMPKPEFGENSMIVTLDSARLFVTLSGVRTEIGSIKEVDTLPDIDDIYKGKILHTSEDMYYINADGAWKEVFNGEGGEKYTHPKISTDTTKETSSPSGGDTITVVKSITVNDEGHVTAITTDDITLPTSTTVEIPDNLATKDYVDKEVTKASYTHPTVSVKSTSETVSPKAGDSFVAVKSVTTNAEGHVTGITTDTITLPENSASYTHPTFNISPAIEIVKDNCVTAIKNITVNKEGHVTGYTAETFTLPDTYTHPTVSVDKSTEAITEKNISAIKEITVDESGHVTAINTETFTLPEAGTNYTHPTFAISPKVDNPTSNSVSSIKSITVNTEGHVTGYSTESFTLPEAYTHPTVTAKNTSADSELYSNLLSSGTNTISLLDGVTVNTEGHVTGVSTKNVKIVHPLVSRTQGARATATVKHGGTIVDNYVSIDDRGHVNSQSTKTYTVDVLDNDVLNNGTKLNISKWQSAGSEPSVNCTMKGGSETNDSGFRNSIYMSASSENVHLKQSWIDTAHGNATVERNIINAAPSASVLMIGDSSYENQFYGTDNFFDNGIRVGTASSDKDMAIKFFNKNCPTYSTPSASFYTRLGLLQDGSLEMAHNKNGSSVRIMKSNISGHKVQFGDSGVDGVCIGDEYGADENNSISVDSTGVTIRGTAVNATGSYSDDTVNGVDPLFKVTAGGNQVLTIKSTQYNSSSAPVYYLGFRQTSTATRDALRYRNGTLYVGAKNSSSSASDGISGDINAYGSIYTYDTSGTSKVTIGYGVNINQGYLTTSEIDGRNGFIGLYSTSGPAIYYSTQYKEAGFVQSCKNVTSSTSYGIGVALHQSNGMGDTTRWSPIGGSCDLGSSGHLWEDIYANNTTIQTSDRNAKDDITSLDENTSVLFIEGLNPVSYKMKDGTSGRTHYGLIAQDVEDTMTSLGITSKDFAGLCKDGNWVDKEVEVEEDVKHLETDPETGKTEVVWEKVPKKEVRPVQLKEGEEGFEWKYSLRYTEFIAPMIKHQQHLSKEIDALQTENAELKATLNSVLERLSALENK